MDYISRPGWGARHAPDVAVANARRSELFIHHTLLWASDHADCPAAARQIEAQHHRQWGFSVGYNELLCPHLVFFEGAGAGRRGQHCPRHNTTGIGIGFMGDGRRPVPDAVIVELAARLRHHENRLGRRLALYGHRDRRATECPGDGLYARLGAIRWLADSDPTYRNDLEDRMAREITVAWPGPADDRGRHPFIKITERGDTYAVNGAPAFRALSSYGEVRDDIIGADLTADGRHLVLKTSTVYQEDDGSWNAATYALARVG